MTPRNSEDLWGSGRRFPRSCAPFVLTVLMSLSAAVDVAAQTPEETLRAGHTALQKGEWARGLELLEQVPQDPQVAYYRGYALEKLQRCGDARASYLAVGSSDQRMAAYALEALAGLDERCVPPVERGSGRLGWKIAGWSSMALGTLTVLLVPAKASIENKVAGQAEEYFLLRHGCEVDGEAVGGVGCKEGELREDDSWTDYQNQTKSAARSTRYLLIGGGAAIGLGLATVLTVAFTRPGAVTVAAAPTRGGASVGVVLRF